MQPTPRQCPGCGLAMPAADAPCHTYFHTSPECWSVFGEVLAREFQDPVLFRRVHQLSVDTYAAQHAGGSHPAKSVCIHLVGLHLALERGLPSPMIPPRLQRLARGQTAWPEIPLPTARGPLTVFDIALATDRVEHEARVQAWARQVWEAFRDCHGAVAKLASHWGLDAG